jgi:hypothetical protein
MVSPHGGRVATVVPSSLRSVARARCRALEWTACPAAALLIKSTCRYASSAGGSPTGSIRNLMSRGALKLGEHYVKPQGRVIFRWNAVRAWLETNERRGA